MAQRYKKIPAIARIFFVAEPYAGTIDSTGQLSTQAPQSVQAAGSIT